MRRDVGNAATGPCHALQRSAWIGVAVAVAWNVVGFPLFEDHGRDLGPMSREIAARFGEAPVVGYMLTEDLISWFGGRARKPVLSARLPIRKGA